MTTGQRIAARRHAKGLTQRQLAEQAGIHPNTIVHYENDQTDLTLLKAACIADVLGVSLDYLARRTTDPTMIGGDGRDRAI